MNAYQQTDALLTIQEAAKQLGVNHKTIRNWIRNGELAAAVLSERVHRIRQSDVDEMVDRHTHRGGR